MRSKQGWTAAELDLGTVAELDEVLERMRDAGPDAEVSVLFVESDDVYLAIVRLDDGEDVRVFASDSAFAHESRLGALLLSDVETPALEIEDVVGAAADEDADPDSEVLPAEPDADPVGDPDLLADLGVSAHALLALCAREGMLPADITAEVCQAIGCGDEVEELRDA